MLILEYKLIDDDIIPGPPYPPFELLAIMLVALKET